MNFSEIISQNYIKSVGDNASQRHRLHFDTIVMNKINIKKLTKNV